MKYRWIGVAILVAPVMALAGCRERPSPPEQALAAYIASVREHRCDAAMGFLSARTRHAVESLIARPQHPHSRIPIEHYYCYDLMFEHCNADEMTLSVEQGDAATVSMSCGRTQDSILPGLTSVFLKYEPRLTELVRENNSWRVVLPTPIRIVELREQSDAAQAEALRAFERQQRRQK